jgi:IS1 family transposase/transposase-like protein
MLDHSASPILPRLCQACYLLVLWLLFRRWWMTLRRPKPATKGRRRQLGPTKPPPCPACQAECEAEGQTEVPPAPPPRIEQKRGRPREVDTSSHYCPNQKCRYYGWAGLGNIRANGHPNAGRWRQLQCLVCGKCFMETTHTIFFGKRVPAETIWQALKALAEGLDIRATARVFEVDPNTVGTWLRQAATHMEAVSHYLIHDLQLTQVQVDELWALLGRQDEAPNRKKHRATRWVWAGIDSASKLLLACVVGDRSVETAQILIHLIVGLLAPGCLPLFMSDQWSPYATALLTHFGHWVAVPRRHPRGRPPQPRWRPLPGLQYAQVVKRRVKGRVVEVSGRVVYGSRETINAILQQSGVGQVINTAFIERLNLSIRQGVAALGRKVTSLAKTDGGLRDQLSLWRAYYNFCLPHSTLRLPLPEPQPTKGNGSPRKWQQRTPAMAAGLTDHIWRMEELLLFRVPPWSPARPAETAA